MAASCIEKGFECPGRRTYAWIFVIQAIAYYGKLAIHPTPLVTLADLWERAAIGPIPGGFVVAAGVLFHGGWAVFAFVNPLQ